MGAPWPFGPDKWLPDGEYIVGGRRMSTGEYQRYTYGKADWD